MTAYASMPEDKPAHSSRKSEEIFTIAEAMETISTTKNKIVLETFAKQITTYAIIRILHKQFEHKKWARVLIGVGGVAKWGYDVYKLACNSVPRQHQFTATLLQAAKFMEWKDDEEWAHNKVTVSFHNLAMIMTTSPVSEIRVDKEKKATVVAVESYEGKRAAVIVDGEFDENKSGTGTVSVISKVADKKTAAYWAHAVNSYLIRTEGPGLYSADVSGGETVMFFPEEWPKNNNRPHPSHVEIAIGKEVSNAFEAGLRRGIILTGPIGTGKTSSIMNALSKIEGIRVIRVKNLRDMDAIYSSFEGIGNGPVIVLIDDVDRMITNEAAASLMRSLDGSNTTAPVITIMTANDPAGKLPPAIYNRRRRVDSIISTHNPNDLEELKDIVFNACEVCKCELFEIDEAFVKGVTELGANHADIASAIETAKYIDKIPTIDADIIMQYLAEQKDGVENAKRVSVNYGLDEAAISRAINRHSDDEDDENEE